MTDAPIATLFELVLPQQTNHHRTLYGGAALALMDKTGFLAASRYARRSFVTAASREIAFHAPARQGELVELQGGIARVGRTSVTTTVSLYAEDLLTGVRRLCTRGEFVFAAVDDKSPIIVAPRPAAPLPEHALRMVDMIFPGSTGHEGALYGGTALELMGKAAFIAATRLSRRALTMASAQDVVFHRPAYSGELVELLAVQVAGDDRNTAIAVTLQAENILTGVQRLCAQARFIMAE